jgi:capsule biosynthesis phosphatase
MKRLIIDLDGTITLDDPTRGYDEKEPNVAVVSRIKEYRALGYEIVIYSARNMKTYGNSVGKINAFTLPVILDWLHRHGIPFDEVHVGKPWCGTEGFYVDDRAIRPAEFISLSSNQIADLLEQKIILRETQLPTEIQPP